MKTLVGSWSAADRAPRSSRSGGARDRDLRRSRRSLRLARPHLRADPLLPRLAGTSALWDDGPGRVVRTAAALYGR
jgi:hypothetical protein